jgi:hypothetical protein
MRLSLKMVAGKTQEVRNIFICKHYGFGLKQIIFLGLGYMQKS